MAACSANGLVPIVCDARPLSQPNSRSKAMRTFNTAGPVAPDTHYSIPPLERWALEDVLHSIRHGEYFVLHAPRQTGKTSTLLALQDLLNSGSHGEYRCVYANIEAGQASREDVRDAMQTILDELGLRARLVLRDEFVERAWPGILERSGPNGALKRLLSEWAEADPRPLVLLLDEIDALVGDTLLSVLRQIRTGYPHRPGNFPKALSCAVCAMSGTTAFTQVPKARAWPAAAPSTSRPSRCALGTLSVRMSRRSWDSTRRKPARPFYQRLWTGCGRKPKASLGSSTRCATRPVSRPSGAETGNSPSPRPTSLKPRNNSSSSAWCIWTS